MILPYDAEPMTAGDLRNKLKGVSNDTPIFIVVDKSEENYDDYGNLRVVHPIDHINREWVREVAGLEDIAEQNVIIHLADGFYENYECKNAPM